MTFLYEVQHVITAWSSVMGAGRHPDRAVCCTWYARGPSQLLFHRSLHNYIIIYRLRVYIEKKFYGPWGVSGQPETPPATVPKLSAAYCMRIIESTSIKST